MAKKKSTKKKNSFKLREALRDERVHKILGLFLILFAFFMLIAFSSHLFTFKADQSEVQSGAIDTLVTQEVQVQNALGRLGAVVSNFFINQLFGLAAYFLIFLCFAFGFNLLVKKVVFSYRKVLLNVFVLIIWFTATLAYFNMVLHPDGSLPWGGAFGNYLTGTNGWLTGLIKPIGIGALLVVSLITMMIWVFNIDFGFLLKMDTLIPSFSKSEEKKVDENGFDEVSVPISTEETIFEKENIEVETTPPEPIEEPPPVVEISTDPLPEEPTEAAIEEEFETVPVQKKKSKPTESNEDLELAIEETVEEKTSTAKTIETSYDPTLDLSNYKFPTLDLLAEHGGEKVRMNAEELERNKNQIIETLNNYNIQISKIKATIGPTVTLYEIVPAPGVRISKIKNLEDDIALSLAALGIRIIAPIPGKGTIGIEVPNQKKEIVSMKSMIASEKFRNSKMDLPICVGKSISNEIHVVDLAKMPHLLMAGATGQGKSVGINAILVSLLYKKHPAELKFVMVDPKKVELSIYNAIEKHYLAKLPDSEDPIITDVKKVVNTLNSLCIEMDNRYELLKSAMCRNIREYNQKFKDRKLNPENGHHFMPFIVVVVDEFADLIMTAGKEVEMPIARIAQLARAVGIHLILATQRPSVNIITGVIKANFPARISFKVTSKVDSRTILDAGGADQLIGRGDMLVSQGSDIVRLQCGFVDTPEVELIVKHIQSQQGYPEAFLLPEYVDESEAGAKGGYSASERDALFADAARVIVQNQMGSTSLIQRRLKLGYNRAGRLMDQLEDAGIVGPNVGSKAREVLITTEMELEQYLEQIG